MTTIAVRVDLMSWVPFRLKQIFQRELHGARARCRRDSAEQRVGERRVRQTDAAKPVDALCHARSDLVEQVECLYAQLELTAPRDRELAAHRRVHSPCAGASQC